MAYTLGQQLYLHNLIVPKITISFSIAKYEESDIDPIFSHTGNERDVCHKKKGDALYIDARVNAKRPKDMIPWDETDDVLTKVSPT